MKTRPSYDEYGPLPIEIGPAMGRCTPNNEYGPLPLEIGLPFTCNSAQAQANDSPALNSIPIARLGLSSRLFDPQNKQCLPQ